jgi:hypothetical protein
MSESCKDVPKIIHIGHFYRKSDGRTIQRLKCKRCLRGFSSATTHPCYRQNKRQFNFRLMKLLCSGISLRRAAMVLNLHRTTVVRKSLFLFQEAEKSNEEDLKAHSLATNIEFDEMESFEHSKCKPLSIPMIVESKSRRILAFDVCRMPAKGKLSAISIKKYGPRADERSWARQGLFKKVSPHVCNTVEIGSDQNPHYPKDIRKHFPNCLHKPTKGRRGCVVGQGELKGGGFDPIFSFNHTAAMLRANINRLFRRTWCTTKKPERLKAHIALYVHYHNHYLI